MKLDFTGIIKFNKKLNRQTELKDKKKAELDKSNLSLSISTLSIKSTPLFTK